MNTKRKLITGLGYLSILPVVGVVISCGSNSGSSKTTTTKPKSPTGKTTGDPQPGITPAPTTGGQGTGASTVKPDTSGDIITPNSFTSTVRTAVARAEFKNYNFRTIKLPNVETIDIDGFYGSTKLTTLIAPKLKTIGAEAFRHSKDFLKSLSLPEVETIGPDAFRSSLLTSLSLPKVKTILDGAFSDSQLTTLTLPLVEEIGTAAFQYSELTHLVLPKVKKIDGMAFKNMVHEGKVTLNKDVKLDGKSIKLDANNKITNPEIFFNVFHPAFKFKVRLVDDSGKVVAAEQDIDW